MELYPLGWFHQPSPSYTLMRGDDHSAAESKAADGHADASALGITSAASTESIKGIPDFDELLYVRGKQVVWQSGFGVRNRVVLKSFQQAMNSKQAVLCNFTGISDSKTNSSRSKCLCILQGLECVKVYAPDGAEFEVALPCKASRLWELPRGILVERAIEDHDEVIVASEPIQPGKSGVFDTPRQSSTQNDVRTSLDSAGFSTFFDSAPDQAAEAAAMSGPMFFSLFHPLEELKPVSYTHQLNFKGTSSPTTAMDDGNIAGASMRRRADSDLTSYPTYLAPSEFMCDPDEIILMCNSELKIVVTYHRVREAHSIWFMVPSTALELVNESGQLVQDPSMVQAFIHPQDGTPRSKSSTTSFWDDVGSTRSTRRFTRKLSHDFDTESPEPSPRASRLSLGSRSGTRRPRTKESRNSDGGFERRLFMEDDALDETSATCNNQANTAQMNQDSIGTEVGEDDDDSDDVIESELFLQCVWTEASGASPNGSDLDYGFVAHDETGLPLICVMAHATNTLKMYQLNRSYSLSSTLAGIGADMFQTNPSSARCSSTPDQQEAKGVGVPSIPTIKVLERPHLKVRSAQPIVGTGSKTALDIIVLGLDGQLYLYRGSQKLCSISLPRTLPPQVDGRVEEAVALFPHSPGSRTSNASSPQILESDSANLLRPTLQVIGLKDSVSNRVNLVLADGQILRVSLPMNFNSPLLIRALDAIDCATIPQVSLRIRVDTSIWIRYMVQTLEIDPTQRLEHDVGKDHIGNNLRDIAWGLIESGTTQLGTRHDLEWVAFLMLIAKLMLLHERELTEMDCEDHLPPPPASNTETHKSDDAWAALLRSDFHQEFIGNHGTLKDCLLTDGVEEKVSATEPTIRNWWNQLDTKLNDVPQVHTNPTEFMFSFPCIFGAIHLVYQDCRLNQLDWPLLRPLAAALTGMAESMQMTDATGNSSAKWYKDHYERDLGQTRYITFPCTKGAGYEGHSLPFPPDIKEWLLTAIRGDSTFVETRPFPFLSSCEFTQQLCCFYGLLAGGSGNSATRPVSSWVCDKKSLPDDASFGIEQQYAICLESKSPELNPVNEFGTFGHWMEMHGFTAHTRAERVVLGMVWYEFEPQSLDFLPVGLAVPLREALHHCRNKPSSRWPADAFVLVGREDIAALVLAPEPTCGNTNMMQHETNVKREEDEPSQTLKTPKPDLRSTTKQESDSSINDEIAPNTSAKKSQTAVTPIWHRNHEIDSANGIASTMLWDGIHLREQHKHLNWLKDPTKTSRALLSKDDPTREDRVNAGTTPQTSQQSSGIAATSGEKQSKRSTFVASRMLNSAQETGYGMSRLAQSLMSVADYARLSTSVTTTGAVNNEESLSGPSWNETSFPLNNPGDLATTGLVIAPVPGVAPNSVSSSGTGDAELDPSGFQLLLRLSSLRFGSDRRMKEVCRILRSSTSVRLVVERKPETTDHELVAAQQARLLQLAYRTMALPVARGMVTLATSTPLLTESVQIPSLCLSGRVPPKNAIIKLDLGAVLDGSQVPEWPSFHNGAAAGFRLSVGVDGPVTPLTRTWIIYNKPPTPNFTHAGFLLSLGLQGQLAALTRTDTYDYLAQRHEATTVAILLGMSAAKRGTMEPTTSKMLCIHIPSLLPPALAELEIASTVQTAAIIGVGLLYQDTAHRLMTEFLLAEIGRRPTSDRCSDRESYSLSAGLALGLVTLGHGATPGGLLGLADLHLEDRLHQYMVGGVDTDAYNTSMANDPTKCSRVREGPNVNINVTSAGATLALGLIFLKSGNESVAARLALPDTHFLLDYVRPDLLMLRVLARSLVMWDTVEPTEEWLLGQLPQFIHNALARLRPPAEFGGGTNRRKSSYGSNADRMRDSTGSRLSRRPSSGIHQPVDIEMDAEPAAASSIAQELSANIDSDAESFGPDDIDLDMFSIVEPAENDNSTRLSSGSHHGIRSSIGSQQGVRSSLGSVTETDRSSTRMGGTGAPPVDEQSIRQAHANIIAGACLSIGFRYVGTAHQMARDTLIKYVERFKTMRSNESDSVVAAQTPDTSTLEMCLGSAVTALAMVMAGTGDLVCLKLIRSLRWKVDDSVTYGQHMCISMAIGLLFLGGGRSSLSDSNQAIAMLLCSLFPRFPVATDDNQYHLQALRHFYVLAAENRCINAYDVTSKSPCYVPLEVTLRENALASPSALSKGSTQLPPHVRSTRTTVRVVAPGLLPPFRWITSIKVVSPRYWPLEIHLDGEEHEKVRRTLFSYRTICVKRKVGHLSYVEDPRGLSSLLSRPRPKLSQSLYQHLVAKGDGELNSDDEDGLCLSGDISDEFLKAFTEDPYVLAFAKQFCSNQAVNPTECVADQQYHQLDLGYGYNREESQVANALYNDPSTVYDENAQFAEFCTASLYHCLTHDKPDILNTMLALYQVARAIPRTRHSLHMSDLHLLSEFYEGPLLSILRGEEGVVEDDESRLVPGSFLASLRGTVSAYFRGTIEQGVTSDSLIREYLTSGCGDNVNKHLHSYLAFNNIPMRSVLEELTGFAGKHTDSGKLSSAIKTISPKTLSLLFQSTSK